MGVLRHKCVAKPLFSCATRGYYGPTALLRTWIAVVHAHLLEDG
jgi:hypothetical protein